MRSRLFTGFGVLGLRGLPFEVARRNHLLEHVFGVARPRCATGAKGSDRLTAMAAPVVSNNSIEGAESLDSGPRLECAGRTRLQL